MEDTASSRAKKKSKWPFVIAINFFSSLSLASVIGLMLPLTNGAPLTVEGFLLAIGWGTPVATIFTTVVPLMSISTHWAEKYGVPVTSPLHPLVRDLFMVTIMFLVLGFVLTGVLSGWDPSTYMARWLGVIPNTWAAAYVMTLVMGPVNFWLASKVAGGVPAEFAPPSAEEGAAAA